MNDTYPSYHTFVYRDSAARAPPRVAMLRGASPYAGVHSTVHRRLLDQPLDTIRSSESRLARLAGQR